VVATAYNAAVLIEAESIPYEPAQLRGERLLVLAPHPDDEAIACGGLIALHLREKRAVRVIVATDGGAQGTASLREEESCRGLARLGENGQLTFLGFPDRALSDDVATRLREELQSFRPDLVLVPSPIEFHPDHYALARIFCELLQRDETLFADLAVARVAFYEVGQPLRPNALVDITDVAELKWAAIAEHASQLEQRDYASYARGLNAYRAMTLPPSCKFAEAYFVVDLPSLRTTPFSRLRGDLGAPRDIVVSQPLPISVVIRTKDRPALLQEAIDSVRATQYPCEIVIVNDGGVAPTISSSDKIINHETPQGRSEAANAGARASSNAYLAFLDDDDLFYPEHLTTLATAARMQNARHAAWYSDAVSAFLRPAESGGYETHSRMRLFAQDFDRDLLLVDNYIPLPTLLVPRETFLHLGGFDPAFDLFEDWDFLIRLSQEGTLLRIPRITCEVRHFEGGSSIVLAAPEGSARFRAAKLQVWQKHASLLDHDVFANAFERQKRRLQTQFSELVESKGATEAAQVEIARALRESVDRQNDINGYMLVVRELEGMVASLEPLVPLIEEKTKMIEELRHENGRLDALVTEVRGSNDAAGAEIARLHVEIERLNGLLNMIYGSRTWKLHTLAQKLKGRG
jgi:LmbE family N-acetylglucosaminyl deacetylase